MRPPVPGNTCPPLPGDAPPLPFLPPPGGVWLAPAAPGGAPEAALPSDRSERPPQAGELAHKAQNSSARALKRFDTFAIMHPLA
jgi:hypothetical protein